MIEQDYDFDCPYCGVENSVRLDVTGGSRQTFVQDCVTCCQPIQISVKFEKDELVELSAEREE